MASTLNRVYLFLFLVVFLTSNNIDSEIGNQLLSSLENVAEEDGIARVFSRLKNSFSAKWLEQLLF